MAKIEEKVEELIKDKIENIGYNLYDVEYAKEGPNYFLRIYIDSPKGIDLDDCDEDVTRPALGDALVSLQDLIIEKDPTAFQLFKSLTTKHFDKPETEIEALNETISYFSWIFERYDEDYLISTKDDYLILIQNVVFLAEQLKESLEVQKWN